MRVLLIDGDVFAGPTAEAFLAAQKVSVELARTAQEGIDLARAYEFDCVVLAPCDVDGAIAVARLRRAQVGTPALVLLRSGDTEDRMAAFASGADDVQSLPCPLAERLARVQAIVRRGRGHVTATLSAGPLELDMAAMQARVHGVTVRLTPKETAVCELLLLRRNVLVTRDSMLNHLYGGRDEPAPKILDVFVCKLRRKLANAGAPGLVETVWGRGYALRVPGAQPVSTQPGVPVFDAAYHSGGPLELRAALALVDHAGTR